VKDIDTAAQTGSWPGNGTVVGSTLYFQAHNSEGGGIWKTDGSAPGTIRVASVVSAQEPTPMTAMGGNLYFGATDPSTQQLSLWKNDGIASSVSVVKQLDSPGTGARMIWMLEAGSRVFFVVRNASQSQQSVWTSDGTSSGTVQLGTFVAIGAPKDYRAFAANGALYFVVEEGTDESIGIWKSDGTPTGTVQLKNIPQERYPHSCSFVSMNGNIYFAARLPGYALALWKSDGTPAGTVSLEEITLEPFLLDPSLAVLNGWLYFVRGEDYPGSSLWKTDGSVGGAVKVKSLVDGNGCIPYYPLTVVADRLFFVSLEYTYTHLLQLAAGFQGGVFVSG